MAMVFVESLTVPRPTLASPSFSPFPRVYNHPINSIKVNASLNRVRSLKLDSGSSIASRTSSFFNSPKSFRSRIVCEAQDTAVDVPSVGDTTWKSFVIESTLPVLVEFWAPWCGPCRMIHPVIDELAKQYSGKLKCYKVNTDESPSIATQYGIRSIPTVMIFKNGEKKDAIIGAVPKSTLTSSIEKLL